MVAIVFPDWAKSGAVKAFKAGRPHALPSVSLVQTAFESTWFTRTCGAYNLGGVKRMAGHPWSTHTTHEGASEHPVQQDFRDFASFDEYFAVHADILEHAAGCADYRAALDHGGPMKAVYLFGGGTVQHPRYATGDRVAYGDALASMLRAHPDLLALDKA